jgi:hypothetical protein
MHYSNNKKESEWNKLFIFIPEILQDIIKENNLDKEEKILSDIMIKKESISLYIMFLHKKKYQYHSDDDISITILIHTLLV